MRCPKNKHPFPQITGYARTWLEITMFGQYRTIDFIAKSAQTSISFMSWYVSSSKSEGLAASRD